MRVGGVVPTRVVHGDVRYRLLPDHLRNLLIGVCRLASQVEHRVAGVHNRRRVVLAVVLVELREGLADHGHGDVAASGDRDHPLEIGDGADVRKLVEHEVHASREPSRESLERALAEGVERLLHEQREYEVEGGVCVRHRREHCDLYISVSHVVEGHLVKAEKLAHLGDVEGFHANVARDHDGFEGLARSHFELLVARQGEVVLGSHGLCHLDPRPIARVRGECPGARIECAAF